MPGDYMQHHNEMLARSWQDQLDDNSMIKVCEHCGWEFYADRKQVKCKKCHDETIKLQQAGQHLR